MSDITKTRFKAILIGMIFLFVLAIVGMLKGDAVVSSLSVTGIITLGGGYVAGKTINNSDFLKK